MSVIQNPVLPGFHPDPSFLRVGDDYYLATSTFEWRPGVRLHHSRDLVHWRELGGVLGPDDLDLTGVPDSGGVWAPDLTHAGGRFHLLYSVVDNYARGYKDLRNLLVTAEDLAGPWTAPVPLPGRGFDAALFHDEDGSTWLLNMLADPRPGKGFSGIEAQRLDDGVPTGARHRIFTGTAIGVTEGPHLYRRDGLYYLMVAEGGTGYDHQVTVARSANLTGPYEVDPAGPMITARPHPELPFQKAGHGCLVETQGGEWYLSYLMARPYTPRGACVLGRESALAAVEWVDGWPRVPGGVPSATVPAPRLPAHPWEAPPALDDFDAAELGPQWSTLRRPATPDWLRLDVRPGHLRIHGGQGPFGLRAPSLVGRPVTSAHCEFSTVMELSPSTVHQFGGLTAYYNSANWHYLHVAFDGTRTVLALESCAAGARTVHFEHELGPNPVRMGLKAEFDGPVVRFSYDEGEGWQAIPAESDATVLSDEHATEIIDGQVRAYGFTGAFVGLWVQDLAAEGFFADFDHAAYEEHEIRARGAGSSAPTPTAP